jgi:hypothetical protein
VTEKTHIPLGRVEVPVADVQTFVLDVEFNAELLRLAWDEHNAVDISMAISDLLAAIVDLLGRDEVARRDVVRRQLRRAALEARAAARDSHDHRSEP